MTNEQYQAAREAEWARLIHLVNLHEITIQQANGEFDAWVLANHPKVSA